VELSPEVSKVALTGTALETEELGTRKRKHHPNTLYKSNMFYNEDDLNIDL
jgi:hypothetical protein